MACLNVLGGLLAAGRRWGSVSREACEDAPRDAEGALFHPSPSPRAAYTRHRGALVCGRALDAGVICLLQARAGSVGQQGTAASSLPGSCIWEPSGWLKPA